MAAANGLLLLRNSNWIGVGVPWNNNIIIMKTTTDGWNGPFLPATVTETRPRTRVHQFAQRNFQHTFWVLYRRRKKGIATCLSLFLISNVRLHKLVYNQVTLRVHSNTLSWFPFCGKITRAPTFIGLFDFKSASSSALLGYLADLTQTRFRVNVSSITSPTSSSPPCYCSLAPRPNDPSAKDDNRS